MRPSQILNNFFYNKNTKKRNPINDRLFLKPYDYQHNAIETGLYMFKVEVTQYCLFLKPYYYSSCCVCWVTRLTTRPQWHLQAPNANFLADLKSFAKTDETILIIAKSHHKNISILWKRINIFYSVTVVKRNLLTSNHMH